MEMLPMTRHILDMLPDTPPVSNWSVIDSCWQVAVHVWLLLNINVFVCSMIMSMADWHIYAVINYAIIGSENVLLSVQRQAII